MECVDDLSQDANKFFNYQRQYAKQQHAKQQVLQKRVCDIFMCQVRRHFKGTAVTKFIWALRGEKICVLLELKIFSLLLQQLENQARIARGEQPLPEDDINKMFKPPPQPSRLDSLLLAGQINCYADQITEFATQSFGKLFMAESLQGESKPKAT